VRTVSAAVVPKRKPPLSATPLLSRKYRYVERGPSTAAGSPNLTFLYIEANPSGQLSG
jgi:hypothetical protein